MMRHSSLVLYELSRFRLRLLVRQFVDGMLLTGGQFERSVWRWSLGSAHWTPSKTLETGRLKDSPTTQFILSPGFFRKMQRNEAMTAGHERVAEESAGQPQTGSRCALWNITYCRVGT